AAVAISQRSAAQRVVIRLGASAGKHDLAGQAPEQASHLPPGGLHRASRRRAVEMRAGWISEMLFEVRAHGRDHFGIERRGGVVLQVEGRHAGSSHYVTAGFATLGIRACMRDHLAILTQEFRPTLRLAAPLVLAELGWMGMTLVDTVMVGRLGPTSI